MIAAALSALALAPPAGEAPLLTLGTHFEGSCLHATGAPGEVAVSDENGVRFLQAGPNGFTRAGAVPVTDLFCPSVAVSPNGTGVLATKAGDDPRRVFVALRAPGGAWGAAVPIADLSGDDADFSVAVADSGDAVVAWSESTDTTHRWRVARRPAGAAAFLPAETIGGDRPRDGGIWAGVDNAGETVVVTAAIESARPPFHVPVRVAIAPRGGAFGAPDELGALPWRSTPALTVAPDGRAVVAFPDGASLRVAEREPGGSFGAAAPVAPASDAAGVDALAQLGPGGEGAVAWTGSQQGGAGIVTRPAAGAWSAPVAIAAKAPLDVDPLLVSETWTALPGLNGFFEAHPERFRLTPGGAALARRVGDRVALSTVALGGTAADTQVAGHELGTPFEFGPLALPDGTPALAWSESLGDYERLALHLAAAGLGAPPDPPAPTIRVGKVRKLVLPISCSAACWVRARVVGHGNQGFLSLTKAGHGRLEVGADGLPAGRVRIRVLYSAPKALVPRERIVTAHVAGDGPAIRVAGLRARRDGADVTVTWRVARPEKSEAFAVTGTATRSQAGEPLALSYSVSSHAKRAFLVTLRNAPDARFVALRTVGGVRLIVPVR